MDYFGSVLVRQNVQEQVWPIGVFWFYVELFHLLFYKYLYGIRVGPNRRCAFTVDVLWRQQFIITDVRFWAMRERTHT